MQPLPYTHEQELLQVNTNHNRMIRVALQVSLPELAKLKAMLPPEAIVSVKDDPENRVYKDRFLVRKGKQLISVSREEIAYFYSRSRLSYLKTFSGKEYIVRMTLEDIENTLLPARFFRLNRQVIASHNAIKRTLIWFNGNLKVELEQGDAEGVIISRSKAAHFRAWLGE